MMKKHLAIICGIFYPNPSATGQCAKRFAELLSDEYDIDMICMSEDEKTAEVDLGNGIRVHKLAGRRMSAEGRSRGGLKKLLHLLGGVQIKTLLLGNLAWYRRAARSELERLHSERPMDAVFSICSPFAAHFAAMDFKRAHPTVRWCGYTVDPYAAKNRIRPVWCSFERLIAEENAVLRRMDAVLLSEEVYKNRPELYAGCRDCKELPYILPDFPEGTVEHQFFDEADINCVYAGSFYRDIRNPECMLRQFANIQDPRIKLHLFSSGCEDLVSQFAAQSASIVVHPRVTADEMVQVYREADVLVNIGNATAEFLPSKTFEYIATGKPIISYFYKEQDSRVLGLYPMCRQIPNAMDYDSIGSIEDFVLENVGRMLSADEIGTIYERHSPQHIARILRGTLEVIGKR